MKFAFIILGDFTAYKDKADIHGGTAWIVGASDLQEACMAAQQLLKEGVDCIELCGAFGESGARKVIEATENKIPVGYVVHLPEQERLFQELFG